MSKVHILPEEVISKIAAGEVIERPASVIKELLENSIDAGATSIEIHLKDAGKDLIHIRDNGHGIEKDDLDKIFYRHSTSKISSIDDLNAIHSLGFRGEALYSIGAISDCTVQSKTKEQTEGWEIHMRAGKQSETRPCAFSERGTDIQVKELFFNTPARKKFLRSTTSEMHQILNTVIPYTIIHKEVRFRISHQGKDLLELSEANDVAERLADVLNLESENFIKAAQAFSGQGITVKMALGDINIKRSRRDMQFIFINNRPVFNKNISFHMNQIYRLIMAPNEFAAFALFINMPAEDIDVNIHPTKREVKLKNETLVCSIIRAMCEQYLMEKSSGKIIRRGAVAASAFAPELSPGASARPLRSPPAAGEGGPSEGRGNPARTWVSKEDSAETTIPSNLFGDVSSDTTEYAFPRSATRVPGITAPGVNDFYIPNVGAQHAVPLQEKLANARFIGVFINKYLLFESQNSLLLVDQHAAQERIFYEKLITQLQKGRVEIQQLLSPVVIALSPQERVVFDEIKENFEKVGISYTLFDEETLAVHAHPALMKDVERAVRGILSGEKTIEFDHDTMARRACRSSIMTGDRLSREQAEHQRNELLNCLDPFTCPHGRPIVIELTEDFLDKQFLRT